ncbi:hypothetical protein PVAP13_3NG080011 [Panicum virgatum]|uniref:Uncharacterized protein n=1 Tax=Panicum virgatum TaxID=38727 RepID=A0A8T0U5Z9_PANVG|nr:hypothetical protein PVAP13_3NG080011 [Panicum virgatum]
MRISTRAIQSSLYWIVSESVEASSAGVPKGADPKMTSKFLGSVQFPGLFDHLLKLIILCPFGFGLRDGGVVVPLLVICVLERSCCLLAVEKRSNP